jgi:D-arabinitol 4-dehydrogenase
MSDSQPYINLHLGLGSFHRAHQALYLQWLHDLGDQSWVLAGGNIRPDMAETIAALQASSGAYTLETVTPQGERDYKRIEAIKQIVPFDVELNGLTKVAVDEKTKIISFTVTEAGYYLDSQDQLDQSYADLVTDLKGETVVTLYGALARLLKARFAAGAGPVTLMNCDNLRSNGDRFMKGFLQFLGLRNETELKAWVENNTSAPNAMVDRITPRPTADVAERVKAATGIDDKAALMGESFIQWVIEDHFIAGRPAWEKVGVEMVEDVGPYEEAKIRCLNATHSCIAWAGTLAGMDYIHEGTQDSEISQLGYNYVTDNVIPALPDCPLDLAKYRDVVLDRFSNPNIQDTNARVAMDGFSKIPGFILPTIRDGLERGLDLQSVSILPALFLAFLIRERRGDIPYPYEDQLMDTSVADAIVGSEDPVKAFVDERLLFNELAGNEILLSAMRSAYQKVNEFIERREEASIAS